MLDIVIERLRQKKRTVAYPAVMPSLPPRFRGRPVIDAARCRAVSATACGLCASVCPVGAISMEASGPALDLGVCVFCGDCARVCPDEALVFTNDWRLASSERDALVLRPADVEEREADGGSLQAGEAMQSLPFRNDRVFRLPPLPLAATTEAGGAFARSLRLRQVSAAGCGACEADLNVLGTVVFDIARLGIDFVASPRHADAMALTGPVPRNMREALSKCLAAMPEPRFVFAVGACAISGGVFRTPLPEERDAGFPPRNEQRAEGALPHLEPHVYIPGCPPHPYTLLDGMLRFLGRLPAV